MHIGIVSPCSTGPLTDLLWDSGGVDEGCGGYFLADLVRTLIDRGHFVSVITLSPNTKRKKVFHGARIQFYVYPMRARGKMRDLFKVERDGLQEGILSSQPDVLHGHWTYEFALACLDTGLPSLITSHDCALQVLRYTKDLYRLGRLFLQIKVVKRARRLSAVSPYVAESLQWLSKTKIEVVPNPITLQGACSGGIRSGPVRIATVLNGWQTLKNPKVAILAFNEFRRQQRDAEMFMFGTDFHASGPAAAWASRRGLNDGIHFCGPLPREKLRRQLEEMSVLLHPALHEACPLSILEAMSVGVPVVAGKTAGGVPWVLDEGRAGFLTDVRKPEAIAQALLQCINERDDAERRRQSAYDRVKSVFSPAEVVRQYENLYEQVVARPRAAEWARVPNGGQ